MKLLSLLLLVFVFQAASADEAKEWHFIENEHLKVGVLKSHGGAIAWISEAGSERNLVNHYDHGRLIQQSYYGDKDDSDWNGKPWRYNPVQGGSWKGVPAEVLRFEEKENVLYVATTPRHWASGALLKEVEFEQWLKLDGPLLKVTFKMTVSGEKEHAARDQELPAVFVNPEWKNLVTYSGDSPWTNAAVTKTVPGWPNQPATLSEHWAAYVSEDDYGLGVYVPEADRATCYRFEGGSGSDCSYIAPLKKFAITTETEFRYDAWFTIGAVAEIRERFRRIHQGNAGDAEPE